MTDRIALTLTGDATRDVPHLESRLGTDAMTSMESARILAAIGDLASLDVLVRFTGHRDPFMRRIAVEALGQHPLAPQAVTTLLSLLHDASPVVVRAASHRATVANRKLVSPSATTGGATNSMI